MVKFYSYESRIAYLLVKRRGHFSVLFLPAISWSLLIGLVLPIWLKLLYWPKHGGGSRTPKCSRQEIVYYFLSRAQIWNQSVSLIFIHMYFIHTYYQLISFHWSISVSSVLTTGWVSLSIGISFIITNFLVFLPDLSTTARTERVYIKAVKALRKVAEKSDQAELSNWDTLIS